MATRAITTPSDLAPLIDRAVLAPDAGIEDVREACAEARQHGLAGVCVRPEWVAEAARLLAGSGVRPIAAVDFPRGASTTAARAVEVRGAVVCGAAEIDVVLPLDVLKRGDYRHVLEDLAEMVGRAGVPVKVILETARLSRDEKVIAAALAKAAGAAFVKTSTGVGGGGATVEDVALLRAVVGPEMGVKASGGVRTPADALRLVEAGASRIGTSAPLSLVTGTF